MLLARQVTQLGRGSKEELSDLFVNFQSLISDVVQTKFLDSGTHSYIQEPCSKTSRVGMVPSWLDETLQQWYVVECQGHCHGLSSRITALIALGALPQTGLDSDQVCLGSTPVDIPSAKDLTNQLDNWHGMPLG